MNVLGMCNDKVGCALGLKCASRTIYGWEIYMRNMAQTINLATVAENVQKIKTKTKFSDTHEIRFCVIRDPVERFVSIYLNKHKHHPDFRNSQERMNNISDYIKSFDEKTQLPIYSNIKVHSVSQTSMYGSDPTVFTHIFNMKELGKLKSMLEKYSGIILPPLKLNSTDHNQKPVLTDEETDWIKRRYTDDYSVYGKWM